MPVRLCEVLKRPSESSWQETKALEIFAEKLQRQLAQAQSASKVLEDHLAADAKAEPRWRNGSGFTPAPIPEEAVGARDPALFMLFSMCFGLKTT